MATLTCRQRQIVVLAGRGMRDKEIAAVLHLSPHTVSYHLACALRRLEARNRAQAAVLLERECELVG